MVTSCPSPSLSASSGMVIFVEHGTLSLAAPLCACASIAAAALLCVLLVLLVLLVLAVLTALNDYRTVCFVVLMRATRAAGCRLNHVLCSSRVAVRGRSNTWRCGAVRPRGLAVCSAVVGQKRATAWPWQNTLRRLT